ncbi:MAG TPA: class I SAM-dependent methyltransferase [Methylomirabilota bacterium]|jgi:predicted O-methyltransferase YrrM|nr:class I SAM-dependent methyltransferase [Methylomirabilota bacterium]
MTETGARMLRLMDRATTLWRFPIIGGAKGRLIRRLIARHRPRAAVEIGSLFGYSAILIAGSLPPGGRLTCIEADAFLAWLVAWNVDAAGLGRRVRVVTGDARRVLARLRGRFDFVLIDAAKEQYLDYLRRVEPKLRPGAVVVADNTKIFRQTVRPYLRYVRESGRYESREYDVGPDAMEVSVLRSGR